MDKGSKFLIIVIIIVTIASLWSAAAHSEGCPKRYEADQVIPDHLDNMETNWISYEKIAENKRGFLLEVYLLDGTSSTEYVSVKTDGKFFFCTNNSK